MFTNSKQKNVPGSVRNIGLSSHQFMYLWENITYYQNERFSLFYSFFFSKM